VLSLPAGVESAVITPPTSPSVDRTIRGSLPLPITPRPTLNDGLENFESAL
jgi:hypothetical protein